MPGIDHIRVMLIPQLGHAGGAVSWISTMVVHVSHLKS